MVRRTRKPRVKHGKRTRKPVRKSMRRTTKKHGRKHVKNTRRYRRRSRRGGKLAADIRQGVKEINQGKTFYCSKLKEKIAKKPLILRQIRKAHPNVIRICNLENDAEESQESQEPDDSQPVVVSPEIEELEQEIESGESSPSFMSDESDASESVAESHDDNCVDKNMIRSRLQSIIDEL